MSTVFKGCPCFQAALIPFSTPGSETSWDSIPTSRRADGHHERALQRRLSSGSSGLSSGRASVDPGAPWLVAAGLRFPPVVARPSLLRLTCLLQGHLPLDLGPIVTVPDGLIWGSSVASAKALFPRKVTFTSIGVRALTCLFQGHLGS